jgi:hypothetical protein
MERAVSDIDPAPGSVNVSMPYQRRLIATEPARILQYYPLKTTHITYVAVTAVINIVTSKTIPAAYEGGNNEGKT